jgi:hypothetical protein
MSTSIGGSTGITFNDASVQNTAATGFGFKNRIINGAMVIDQRNAGASVTQSNAVVYTVDRWYSFGTVASKFTIQQSTDAPTGFRNSAKITSSSAYSVGASEQFIFTQAIEGFNTGDFGFGAAGASNITLSFWVKSSLTGTFAGGVSNANTDRSYPFSYIISAANTWEQKSITIVGDTTGTWNTTNGVGLYVNLTMGAGSSFQGTVNTWNTTNVKSVSGATSVVGTNGATFYITGVQLEKGSTATSFDYRPYGTELDLCMRYCEVLYQDGTSSTPISSLFTGTNHYFTWQFKVQKRASATVTKPNGTWTTATPAIYGGQSTSVFYSPTSQFYLTSAEGTLNLLAVAEL